MRIIAYLNPTSKHSVDIQAVTEKCNLRCEKHDANQDSNAYFPINRTPGQQSSSCIEINKEPLVDNTERIVERQPVEKNFVESIDENLPSSEDVDEEGEAMRIETTRFF